MNKISAAILCTIALCTLFLGEISAQSRYAGLTFSYAGCGLDYSFDIDDKNFAEFQLRAETAEMFRSFHRYPGISASAVWNLIFASTLSRNGNMIRFYSGPGISAGYSRDILAPAGLFFGLKGRVGAECSFPRGISISINLSPMIGGHFTIKDEMLNMRLFKVGLLYGTMPEVSVRYKF